MNRKWMYLLACVLACLMLISACGKPAGGEKPDDPQPPNGDSGSQTSGGSTDPDDLISAQTTVLGEVNGVTYWMLTFDEAGEGEILHHLCAGDLAASGYEKLFETDGKMEYAEGSLESSGGSALYFTVSPAAGGAATLYCYDLYSKQVKQVLAAPCSNMVIFAEGDLAGYGWILQEDYVLAINLRNQKTEMTLSVSTTEVGGFADVGGSFFRDGQTATLKPAEEGVLEITLQHGSSLLGYLYTCDTFTAVKIK